MIITPYAFFSTADIKSVIPAIPKVKKYANKSPEYDSLQAAYDAYVKKITEDDNYLDFKDTLPHN